MSRYAATMGTIRLMSSEAATPADLEERQPVRLIVASVLVALLAPRRREVEHPDESEARLTQPVPVGK